MKQKTNLLFTCFFFASFIVSAQCLTVPEFPACTGKEPLVAAGDNISINQTKYFYGAPATLSNVKLSGGTLVVCGNLTLSEFVFDSGTIFIHAAASLTVSNGAGLVARGNTSIYNQGIFQCLGNYVMDGSYATASKPNILFNVSTNSSVKMPNQYFVINNAHSKFVNNGVADFHGLITDPLAATGSVCLGNNSQTRMTVLYNRAKNPYIAPDGAACVTVSQFSQFYDTLTVYPNINFCLGSTHNSDATCTPWGCKPNAWGAGQVINNCSSCATVLTFLPVGFKKIEAMARSNFNEISWETGDAEEQLFYIQRSTDGSNFTMVDSVMGDDKTRYVFKDYSFKNTNYYKITYTKDNRKISSNIVQVRRSLILNETYPNPFKNYLVIPVNPSRAKTTLIKITDVNGRLITPGKTIVNEKSITLYFQNISNGMYLVSVADGKETHVYKVVKQ